MMRWKLIVGLVGLVVVLAARVLVVWPQLDPITEEHFNRISEGMTFPEVETLLGPAGDYRTGPMTIKQPIFRSPPGMLPNLSDGYRHIEIHWLTDTATIMVDVKLPDETWSVRPMLGELPLGAVTDAYWCDMQLKHGPLDNLLWRAERIWRRGVPE
jgi:hypothetical protein